MANFPHYYMRQPGKVEEVTDAAVAILRDRMRQGGFLLRATIFGKRLMWLCL